MSTIEITREQRAETLKSIAKLETAWNMVGEAKALLSDSGRTEEFEKIEEAIEILQLGLSEEITAAEEIEGVDAEAPHNPDGRITATAGPSPARVLDELLLRRQFWHLMQRIKREGFGEKVTLQRERRELLDKMARLGFVKPGVPVSKAGCEDLID